jgi:hypothetical protein
MAGRGTGRNDADDQSIGPERKNQDPEKDRDTGAGELTSKARGVCQGLYDDAKEAELRAP